MQSSLKLITETTLKLCGCSLWCAGNRYRRCYSDVEVLMGLDAYLLLTKPELAA